MAKLCWK